MQPNDAIHPRRRRARPLLACGLAPLAVALLVAGCGGSSSPGVANLGKSHSSQSPSNSGAASNSGGGGGNISSSSSTAAPKGGVAQSGFSIAMRGESHTQLLKFAACMRANGEPNFPDPNANGVFSGGSAQGLDPSSPQFQRAQQKCAKYTPHGGKPPSAAQTQTEYNELLKYSQCMRSHGVPEFPDPTRSNGGVGLRITGGPGQGLDPGSPIFRCAQQQCSRLPGAPQSAGAGG